MLTLSSVTIRIMEPEKTSNPQPIPPAPCAEACHEANKIRVARENRRERLSPARGVLVAVVLSLIAICIVWMIWRML